MTPHEITIFAYHVQCIAMSEVGDVFTLCLFRGCRVDINVWSDAQVLVNGDCQGNRNGAVSKYASLVNQHIAQR